MTLAASGHLDGQNLWVHISNHLQAQWTEVNLYAVTGGTGRPVSLGEPLTIVIDLADESVTTGSFMLSGGMRGWGGGICHVIRTFTFTIEQDRVTVARAELPLEQHQTACIALVRRDGRDVELDVTSPDPATGHVRWSVSGGRILSQGGPRLRWRLPAQAGLYQAELVVDHGRRGLSFDTLTLAVEPHAHDRAT